tara:strand:+ start:39 stop:500 length:462 start_codon:yes stop_codon:yes gene_type:complete
MDSLIFILDVDGVLTTGQFLYSISGKSYKVFGPHDNDGLKMLKDKIKIKFITADKRGFQITKNRIVDDMGFELDLVSEIDRFNYLKEKYGFSNLIYMGDGYHDAKILKESFFGISPKNARIEARECANYITDSNSGEGAVLDACLQIKEKFLR